MVFFALLCFQGQETESGQLLLSIPLHPCGTKVPIESFFPSNHQKPYHYYAIYISLYKRCALVYTYIHRHLALFPHMAGILHDIV